MGNVSNLQRNMNSLIGSGGHRLDTGGVQITNDAKGFSVMSRMQDTGVANLRGSLSNIVAAHERLSKANSWVNSVNTRIAEGNSMVDALNVRGYEQISQMKAEDIARNYNIGMQDAQNAVNYAKYMEGYSRGKNYNSGTSAQGNLSIGGGLSGNIGFTKTNMGTDTSTENVAKALKGLQASASISGGIGTNVNASNSRLYGNQEQIAEGKDINSLRSGYENVMKQLSTNEKNDEITGLARDRSEAIQNVESLTQEKSQAENELKQAEMGYQSTKQSAVTFDENIADDFVGIAQERYDMSENQAKELLNSHRPEDQDRRKKLIDATIRRQSVRYNFDLPQIETPNRSENMSFNKADLQNEYNAKEQITQSKINDTSEMISQTKQENQTRRAIIAGTVNEKITKTSSEISGETQDVSAKNEAVKQKVKERSKDGALWSAGKVLWSKDDDN